MTCNSIDNVNRPAVSVVVPMYNVERYIRKCVDSLLSQTLTNLEIILVDDGSPDRSGVIAETYALKDDRIKVIHQKNSGLGPARNSGIRSSMGEYIGFVDGDDWVCPSMFENLYETATSYESDIVCGGLCTYSDGVVTGAFVHPLAGRCANNRGEIYEIRKNLYGHKPGDKDTASFPVTVCTNLYKSDFIAESQLSFLEVLSEDTIFNLAAFSKANSIVFSGYADYCYRKDGQNSITQAFSFHALVRSEQFIDALYSRACDEPVSDKQDCLTRTYYAAVEYSRLYLCLLSCSSLSFEEKVNEADKLVHSRMFVKFANRFPSGQLHLYQRLCQSALTRGHLRFALILVRFRSILKKVK